MTRNQKEAVALLSIGTFLEYFDLMIYVHMAVLLDGLFFPTDDARVASLLSACAFCSTFIMRPVGALIFGYIGDHIGRKTTIVFTTFMMAICCAIMVIVPTYAQIGYMASVIVIGCRMLQGMSSMGELVGADVYLSEVIEDVPNRYFGVALAEIASYVGEVAALIVAAICTSSEWNWRYVYVAGGLIAFVGMVGRTRLREAPEFADMKRRIARLFEDANEKHDPSTGPSILDKKHPIWQQKVDRKTSLSFFSLSCGGALCYYFTFIYCGSVLKKLGCTPAQIIYQNMIVCIACVIANLVVAFCTFKIHPLKILKFKSILFLPFILVCPFILTSSSLTPSIVLYLQVYAMCFTISTLPASAVCVVHFPIFKRFTSVSTLFALAGIVVFSITSFGLIYLTDLLGYFGLWVLMIPTWIAFYWGVRHFEFLEYRYSDEELRAERDYMDHAPHAAQEV